MDKIELSLKDASPNSLELLKWVISIMVEGYTLIRNQNMVTGTIKEILRINHIEEEQFLKELKGRIDMVKEATIIPELIFIFDDIDLSLLGHTLYQVNEQITPDQLNVKIGLKYLTVKYCSIRATRYKDKVINDLKEFTNGEIKRKTRRV